MENTTFCVCKEGPKVGIVCICLKFPYAAQSSQGESVAVDLYGFISIEMLNRGRHLITVLIC